MRAGARWSGNAARLAAALAEPGCPVCRRLEADARRDLRALLRECVMDPVGRAALRSAGGFCGWHTALLPEVTEGILSVAILAEDLLRRPPGPRPRCAACEPLRRLEDDYLRALLDHASVSALAAGLRDGPGLPCRPHLARLRTLAPRDARTRALAHALAPREAELRGRLAGFIAKQDHRHREAPTPAEASAWQEALEHLSGRPWLVANDLTPG